MEYNDKGQKLRAKFGKRCRQCSHYNNGRGGPYCAMGTIYQPDERPTQRPSCFTWDFRKYGYWTDDTDELGPAGSDYMSDENDGDRNYFEGKIKAFREVLKLPECCGECDECSYLWDVNKWGCHYGTTDIPDKPNDAIPLDHDIYASRAPHCPLEGEEPEAEGGE